MKKEKKIIRKVVTHRPTCDKVKITKNHKCTCGADKKINWSVYLTECSDGSFYCGISNDVSKRIAKHNSGAGAKYTRSRLPIKLLGQRNNLSRTEAMTLEYMTKKKPRDKKLSFMMNFDIENLNKKDQQND